MYQEILKRELGGYRSRDVGGGGHLDHYRCVTFGVSGPTMDSSGIAFITRDKNSPLNL
jgi:NADH:ubiquinone oxidoreductase subunit D